MADKDALAGRTPITVPAKYAVQRHLPASRHRRVRLVQARLTTLLGRRDECGVLDGLLEGLRGGRGAVLVLHGEAGAGKTALLEYMVESASDLRFVRVTCAAAEKELAFAGLHQVCAPILDRLERLPDPQHHALAAAFGLEAGPAPDRFLVGVAVLALLSEAAKERSLACLIDDAQCLDPASAHALAFAARRLPPEAVLLVFAAREPDAELRGLPGLAVNGLQSADARDLLGAALRSPLDERVADRIVAETRGNPLALLQLSGGRSSAELAGGFGSPKQMPPPDQFQDSLLRRIDDLPEQIRLLLALAAADPTGDPELARRAIGCLGMAAEVAEHTDATKFLDFGRHVVFRQPQARSAAYWAVPPSSRRQVHAALAEATNSDADPDRRVWHLAQATSDHDEKVAEGLEHSAGRAQSRGGLAAAAAFLERSMALTADPARRTERTLAATRINMRGGRFGKALELLVVAEAGPLDDFSSARVDLLRGQIVFASGLGSDAPLLLLKAAKRLESVDIELARSAYMSAWTAALFAGRFAGAGDLEEVSHAARALPRAADPPGLLDLVLDGLALLVTDGPAAAGQTLRRAANAASSADISLEEGPQWGWMAQAACALWDDDTWRSMRIRQVQLARDSGALGQLPIALGALGTAAAWSGDFATAAALAAEADEVGETTGVRSSPFTATLLASLRGDQAAALPLIEAMIAEATASEQGIEVTYAHWAAAILGNGLGRYDDAKVAAQQAAQDTPVLCISMWALPELIEAAVRTGETQLAADALRQLAETTQAGGTDFGLGMEARSRALLSEGEHAESFYRQAIDLLSRTQLRPELARAHLLYGEWLRRENRRVDAREQLRRAHQMLAEMGIEGFAERARRELLATGETVRKRTVDTLGDLTAQEAHIARLAGGGLTNPEISTKLFLSPRTVEWHLRKVFAKLGISSRRQLRGELPGIERGALSA
jgi:DNA-binding CsgD family transcriptional regulator/tetratricopeptide (TPR) repeat protein